MKTSKKILPGLAVATLASVCVLGGITNLSQASADGSTHGSCAQSAEYCLVCDVAEQINALPDPSDITLENAAETIQQIHNIDRIKYDLSDDEFDELTELVDVDTSYYGIGRIVKYYDAIDALNNLQGGVSLQISKMIVLGGETLSDTSETEVSFEIVNMDTNYATQLTMFDLGSSYSEYGADKYELTADGWSFTYLLPAGTYQITEINTDKAVTVNGKTWNNPTVRIQQDGRVIENTTTTITLAEGQPQVLAYGNYYNTVCYNFVDENDTPLTEEVVVSGGDFDASTAVTGFIELIKAAEPQGTLTIESVPAGYCLPDPITYTVEESNTTVVGDLTIDATSPDSTLFTWKLFKHDYGTLIPEAPADCENSGVAAYHVCAECGKYFDEEKNEVEYASLTIPATGHNYGTLVAEVPADCENAGTAAHYQCADCDKYFDEEKNEVAYASLAIPATGHDYGTLVAEVPADCENSGVAAHHVCAECEKYFDEEKNEVEYEDLIIPATGHEYGEWVESKPPTATEAGERERKCLHCEDTQTERIPATPAQYNPQLLLFVIVALLILIVIVSIVFRN